MMAVEFDRYGNKMPPKDWVPTQCLQAVSLEEHRFEISVNWASSGLGVRIEKPYFVVWQDVATGLILGWRCDTEASGMAGHWAAVDMMRQWGVPERVIVTGRNPSLSAASKPCGDDLIGNFPRLFNALGCMVYSQYPYSGKVKPNERALHDVCRAVVQDARCMADAGQFVRLRDFVAAVDDAVSAHNGLSRVQE